MLRLLKFARFLWLTGEWETVPARSPVRLLSGETVTEGWVNRRVNPRTLETEYQRASKEDADNAAWMWAIK